MSRVELLRKEIQNELCKNKYLLETVQNFENARNDILDQIELFYNSSELFTSDSDYSSSDDELIDETNESDDDDDDDDEDDEEEFFESKKAKKIVQNANRFHSHSSIPSPINKSPNINSITSTFDYLKKIFFSPTKSSPASTTQQNTSYNSDIAKLYNIFVQTYVAEVKKKLLNQETNLNQQSQKEANNKTVNNQFQITPPPIQLFFQNLNNIQKQNKLNSPKPPNPTQVSNSLKQNKNNPDSQISQNQSNSPQLKLSVLPQQKENKSNIDTITDVK